MLDEFSSVEDPARTLLVKLGWTYVSREVLGGERDDEREVLLKGRLRAALLRLNEWMTEAQADWVIGELEHTEGSGIARNQRVHEDLIYGKPVSTATASGRQSRIARFFDFEHPEGGLNEFVVTTQFRVRRGNERRSLEDDQRVVKPDLVLFVNGIPLVVMEAKSPSLLDVWKSKAVRQLRRYQEAGAEWHGTGAPELFHTNLLCVTRVRLRAEPRYAAAGDEWVSVQVDSIGGTPSGREPFDLEAVLNDPNPKTFDPDRMVTASEPFVVRQAHHERGGALPRMEPEQTRNEDTGSL